MLSWATALSHLAGPSSESSGSKFAGGNGCAGGRSPLWEPPRIAGSQGAQRCQLTFFHSWGYELPSSLCARTAKQPIMRRRYGIHAVLELFTIHMQFKSHHLTTLVVTSTFQELCIVAETIVFSWFQVPKKSVHSASFMPSSSSLQTIGSALHSCYSCSFSSFSWVYTRGKTERAIRLLAKGEELAFLSRWNNASMTKTLSDLNRDAIHWEIHKQNTAFFLDQLHLQ